MSSSNSFNICPRCGNSNSLNAKYCSRCGAQLKIPTEAVVCHKCHTRNSSLANFCRNCGATLKVGAQTKICPRCGREIGAEENLCTCGYSFVTLQQTEPHKVDVASTNKDQKKNKKHGKHNDEAAYTEASSQGAKKSKPKKGGRGFALFAMLLIAAFAYLIIAQASLRGPLAKFEKGYFYYPTEKAEDNKDKDIINVKITEKADGIKLTIEADAKCYSGYSMIKDVVDLLANRGELKDDLSNINELKNPTMSDAYKILVKAEESLGAEKTTSKFNFYKQTLGTGAIVMLALIAVFLLTSLFHVVSCIVRLISPKRSKRSNWLYLTLAILTTLLVVIILCSTFLKEKEGFLYKVYKFFTPGVTVTVGDNTEFAPFYMGYAIAYIPIAYWLLWLYSCIAKKKRVKKAKDE